MLHMRRPAAIISTVCSGISRTSSNPAISWSSTIPASFLLALWPPGREPWLTPSARTIPPPRIFCGSHRGLLTRQLSAEPKDLGVPGPAGRKIGGRRTLVLRDHDELQAEVLSRSEFGERRIRFQPIDDFYGFSIASAIFRFRLTSRARILPATATAIRLFMPAARIGSRSYRRPPFHSAILDASASAAWKQSRSPCTSASELFRPVRVERVEDHKIHSESYSISTTAHPPLIRLSAIRAAWLQSVLPRSVLWNTQFAPAQEPLFRAPHPQTSLSIQEFEFKSGQGDAY